MSTTKDKSTNSIIRTRFAPSPTGFLHIGGLRTALYSYALAKHNVGDFILRIEDTDQKRQVEGATEALKIVLEKFGLSWDEYFVQSERQASGIYKSAAEKLVESGHAFYCNCDPKNAKEQGYSNQLRDPCRDKNNSKGAIKLKVVDGESISFFDFVHAKEIEWETDTVYDATLLKSDGFPTYHLAVVVDDLDMDITHVLRGHDWLPSTPIHLLVYKFLGESVPKIGHLTDILSSETGKKLSKRRDSVFVEDFIKLGYLPEALLNFVMLLGWAPKDNQELYSLEEFVKVFDKDGFQDANPVFNADKLDWFNCQYIKELSIEEVVKQIKFQNIDFEKAEKDVQVEIAKLVQERIHTFSEFNALAGFFFNEPKVDTSLFGENYKKHLSVAKEVIEKLDKWDLDELNTALMERIKKHEFKVGDFFMTLRIAITGSKSTPPINESMIILEKEKTLERLKKVS